ncbi:MAG: hypothetical protein ACOCWQ_05610 [Nanoarchaeota archaeon]
MVKHIFFLLEEQEMAVPMDEVLHVADAKKVIGQPQENAMLSNGEEEYPVHAIGPTFGLVAHARDKIMVLKARIPQEIHFEQRIIMYPVGIYVDRITKVLDDVRRVEAPTSLFAGMIEGDSALVPILDTGQLLSEKQQEKTIAFYEALKKKHAEAAKESSSRFKTIFAHADKKSRIERIWKERHSDPAEENQVD